MVRKEVHPEETAVSPVIGVILMVAITVILAAVIGTFVVGIGSEVEPSAQAGVTFDYDGGSDELTVNVIDAGNVDALYIENQDDPIDDSDVTNQRGWESDTVDNRAVNNNPDGGDSVVIAGIEKDDDVSVIGEIDGEETLLDAWELE